MLDVDATLATARTDPQPLKPVHDTEALIGLLDPKRDYGERSYEDVISGIRDGSLLIEPGNSLPQLCTAKHQYIKGSGSPKLEGMSAQQRALHQVRTWALDDLEWAYIHLKNGMSRGDPRYDKIFWETALGKMGEAKGSEAMAEAFKALIAAMDKPDVRTVVIDG